MARKNTIKKYVENGYYHIYNRGVDKRDIFLDQQDYKTFLNQLERYLSPPSDHTPEGFKADKPSIRSHKLEMNLNGIVKLLAYCLMPNHFHLLVHQSISTGISKLMKRVCINYSMYFNKKYDRRGGLFESVYKGILVESELQLLHLTRYIHLNPVNIKVTRFGPVATIATASPDEYDYSSYSKYINRQAQNWFDPTVVLDMFASNGSKYSSYKSFVEDYKVDSHSVLGPTVLEEEGEKR